MLHYFNVEIAAKYGIMDATVLQSLAYWLQKNVNNKNNIHDGMAWTFNSVRKMLEYFPYLTYNQLASSLRRLEKNGLVQTSNYNKMGYDRTKWYTLTALGEAVTGINVHSEGGDFGRSRAAKRARLGENNQGFGEFNQDIGYNNQSIVENSTMDYAKNDNGLREKPQPIPIIETNIATVNINNNYAENDGISEGEGIAN